MHSLLEKELDIEVMAEPSALLLLGLGTVMLKSETGLYRREKSYEEHRLAE